MAFKKYVYGETFAAQIDGIRWVKLMADSKGQATSIEVNYKGAQMYLYMGDDSPERNARVRATFQEIIEALKERESRKPAIPYSVQGQPATLITEEDLEKSRR